MWKTKAQNSLCIHTVWSAPLLFAALIVTGFYSSKLFSSIGTYTVSLACQFVESVLSLHVHRFTLQERCYTDSVSLCTGVDVDFFCDKSFDKSKRFCDFRDTDFLIWVDTEVKVYRDAFKKDISFWVYVKIRYGNFSFHIFIVQLFLTICKRTAFCLKNYGSFKGSSTCCVRYVPSDL